MRRILAVMVAVAGMVGGLAMPAQAGREPYSCSGIPNTVTYVCLVDARFGANPTIGSYEHTVPEICIALGFCTDPVTQSSPWPGVDVMDGWWVILWHNGSCYYLYPDRLPDKVRGPGNTDLPPNGCP